MRAKLCTVDALKGYARSSFPKYFKRTVHPPLDRVTLLQLADLPTTLAGMRKYAERLKLLDERDPKQRLALEKKYCRGWFLGSKKAKKELAEKLAESHPVVDWEGVDLKVMNELEWEGITQIEMQRLKMTTDDISQDPKGATWKVAIAKRLRKQTTASNPWIAQRLKMRHPNYLSNLVNKY